jgi:MSHA biogenesis protein MshE
VRLLDMGVPGYMIASTLRAVIAQRLLRVSCNYCAEPYVPLEAEMAWLSHHASATEMSLARFRRGRGCSRCNGMGFTGRQGVYEMIEISKPLIEALLRGDAQLIDRLAREEMGPRTLAHEAVALVLQGRTTAAEAMTIAE